ncbi:MAG: endonuclease/exonuclease/phosphatase family protein [Anaerolineales bacterium]
MVETAIRTPLGTLISRWYLGFLAAWFALYLVFGDGSGYLGLANALAVYFFAPLPFVLLVAIGTRDKLHLAGGLLALAVFAATWGPLFSPRDGAAEGDILRVMSFNVLGRKGDPNQVIASIQAEDADVLLLQEVTPDFAALMTIALEDEYPHQVIDARERASGMAIFSRFPLQSMDVVLDGRWRGDPQVVSLDWNGQLVTLVNFHTLSTGAIWPRWVYYTFNQREEDVNHLVDFAREEIQHRPLIAAGDLNATRLNDAYKAIDEVLDDAWWEAGWGLGHTFPGQMEPDDWFTHISIFIIPHWLVRIDHIFYSHHWQATQTRLADFNGGSDHRGVITELVLED